MIPAVLCRRRTGCVDLWKGSIENAEAREGVLVNNMLPRALAGERCGSGGECFDAAVLLPVCEEKPFPSFRGAGPRKSSHVFIYGR